MQYSVITIVTIIALLAGGRGPTEGLAGTPGGDLFAHNIHVTYATMAITQNTASVRVKYYKHDLEESVATFVKRDSVVLGVDRISDSLYVAYLDSTFRLNQDGRQLSGRVTASGEDGDMWWYQLEYSAPKPITSLRVVNKQLIESFRDQKNILKAQNMDTGARKSFYYNRKAIEFDVSL